MNSEVTFTSFALWSLKQVKTMVFQMHRTQTLLGDYIGTAQLTCSAVKHGILLYRQRNDKKPIYTYIYTSYTTGSRTATRHVIITYSNEEGSIQCIFRKAQLELELILELILNCNPLWTGLGLVNFCTLAPIQQ